MTYTLKLDWSQERIDAVRRALEAWLAAHAFSAGTDSYPAGLTSREIQAALADIALYRETAEQVKRDLTTDKSIAEQWFSEESS